MSKAPTLGQRVGALEAKARTRLYALIAIAALDLVTLVLAITIAIGQGKTLDELHKRTCINSGAVITTVQAQQAQSTPKLYHAFLPNLTNAQIQGLIAQQRQNAQAEISTLRQDCSQDDLNVAPSN